MKENKTIKVPDIEILDDTPEKDKLDYFFKLLAKNKVFYENLKLDIKEAKKDIKEAGFETARLVEAIKYLDSDGINKKAVEADTIDKYMLELKKRESKEGNQFEGLDTKLISLLNQEKDIKEEIKGVQDKIGEVGLDKKAIKNIVEDIIKEHNPNKKPKKVDLDLESKIISYQKNLNESINEIIPLPINKVDS